MNQNQSALVNPAIVFTSGVPVAGVSCTVLRNGSPESYVPQSVTCTNPQTQEFAILVIMPAEGGGIQLHEITGAVESWHGWAQRNSLAIVTAVLGGGTLLAGGLALSMLSSGEDKVDDKAGVRPSSF